ncbi:hypothetical protein QR680_006076 [Steinernema hermaphroditum]|uniref:G-protein coupled receptors family 1 profile domain-containing protein n=1 Tax=Steinernema hermaphroditum TaxID=289476 RepID=A0AA39HVC1_9BILA|nr:hypothetical protein QR680_006076 [Steinernema hermaphroditum]
MHALRFIVALCVIAFLLQEIKASKNELFYQYLHILANESVAVDLRHRIDHRIFLEVYDVPLAFSMTACKVTIGVLGTLAVGINVALAVVSIWRACSPLYRKPTEGEIVRRIVDDPVNIDFYAPRPVAFKYSTRFRDNQTMMLPPSSARNSVEMIETIDRLVSTILPIPHILINVLVIFLSFKKVRHTVIRIFALNLTIPSLVYSLYSTTATVLQLSGAGEHFDLSITTNRTAVEYTTDFVLYFCAYGYRMLAILLVAVTYVSFAQPLFAKKHFKDRTIYATFFVAQIVALLASLNATFSANQSEMLFLKYTRQAPVNWTDYIEGAMEISTFVAFVVLYVVCIKTIVSFNRKPKVVSEAMKSDTSKYYMKRQLLMILFYITPPNVFLIPNSLCTDIMTIFLSFDTPVYHQICYVKVHFRPSLLACRLFLSSFTILFVFTDYRRAFVALFKKKSTVFAIRPSVVSSKTAA